MSEVYGVMTDEELIDNACSAIQSSCHEYCVGDCNCRQVIESLKERFLNV